jgi:hypothetical protein
MSNARTGVAHAMFPALIAAPVPGRQRPPPVVLVSCARAATCGERIGSGRCCRRIVALVVEVGVLALSAIEGTTSISEVVPKVVLSGDVNQGGEMQVLSRELDALNPSEFAVDGVGHDR